MSATLRAIPKSMGMRFIREFSLSRNKSCLSITWDRNFFEASNAAWKGLDVGYSFDCPASWIWLLFLWRSIKQLTRAVWK